MTSPAISARTTKSVEDSGEPAEHTLHIQAADGSILKFALPSATKSETPGKPVLPVATIDANPTESNVQVIEQCVVVEQPAAGLKQEPQIITTSEVPAGQVLADGPQVDNDMTKVFEDAAIVSSTQPLIIDVSAWRKFFNVAMNDFEGYIFDLANVNALIEAYEAETRSKFSRSTTRAKNFGNTELMHVPTKIKFDRYGVAYVVPNKRHYACQYGKRNDFQINMQRKLRIDAAVARGEELYIRPRGTKKVDCPAEFTVLEVLYFPDYSIVVDEHDQSGVDDEDVSYAKRAVSAQLRNDFKAGPIVVEKRFYLKLPQPTDHRNHALGDYQTDVAVHSEADIREVCCKPNVVMVCGFCGKRFDRSRAPTGAAAANVSSKAKMHLQRFHTMRKAFGCVRCRMCFATPTELRRHSLRHAEPSLQCSYCGHQFRRNDQLLQHLAREHEPSRNKYLCSVCPERFFLPGQLKVHLKRHVEAGSASAASNTAAAGDVPHYQCADCGAPCGDLAELRRHKVHHLSATTRRTAAQRQLIQQQLEDAESASSTTTTAEGSTSQQAQGVQQMYHCQACDGLFESWDTFKTHRCVDVLGSVAAMQQHQQQQQQQQREQEREPESTQATTVAEETTVVTSDETVDDKRVSTKPQRSPQAKENKSADQQTKPVSPRQQKKTVVNTAADEDKPAEKTTSSSPPPMKRARSENSPVVASSPEKISSSSTVTVTLPDPADSASGSTSTTSPQAVRRSGRRITPKTPYD